MRPGRGRRGEQTKDAAPERSPASQISGTRERRKRLLSIVEQPASGRRFLKPHATGTHRKGDALPTSGKPTTARRDDGANQWNSTGAVKDVEQVAEDTAADGTAGETGKEAGAEKDLQRRWLDATTGGKPRAAICRNPCGRARARGPGPAPGTTR